MRYTCCGIEVWSWSYQIQGQRKASCLLLKTPVSTSFLNSNGDSVSHRMYWFVDSNMYIHARPLLFSHTPNQSSIYSFACISRSFSIFLQLTISLPWIIYTSPSQPSLFDPSPLVRNNFAYSSATAVRCQNAPYSELCFVTASLHFALSTQLYSMQGERPSALSSTR